VSALDTSLTLMVVAFAMAETSGCVSWPET